MALALDRAEFVKLLLEYGVNFKNTVTVKQLIHLYWLRSEDEKKNKSKYAVPIQTILKRLRKPLPDQYPTIAEIEKLISDACEKINIKGSISFIAVS